MKAIVNPNLRLNSRDIKRSSDICYLGSVVSKDDGDKTDVNVKMQKARGLFSSMKGYKD
jgi:hypothetical protein